MINIDLTTLQGWNDLPDGTYDITIGATAKGYTRIKQSSAVSVVKESPEPAEEYFLTFSSPNSFTINSTDNTKHWDGTLEYSTDKENWNEWDGTTVLNSGSNNELYLRGTGNTIITGEDMIGWQLTGSNISCLGNIETLLDYQTVSNGQHPTMGMDCFDSMFFGCTSLITAPILPATTSVDWCYNSMFAGCTSLTTVPDLPATILAPGCYNSMFSGCTSLTTVPDLPATTLAENCYSSMFFGCTSLIVSDTQTAEAQYEWRIPASGVIGGTTYSQISMFTNCLGTRSSDDLAGEVGQQYIYYTQNPPVGSN